MESPATTEVLGIARKLNKELEELPLHSHGSVISILNTLMQTRQLNMQVERETKNAEAQKAAHEAAIQQQIRKDAANLRLV